MEVSSLAYLLSINYTSHLLLQLSGHMTVTQWELQAGAHTLWGLTHGNKDHNGGDYVYYMLKQPY